MEKVEDLGLLWCSSCFYFENFNRELRRLFHGNQSIETQVAFALCVYRKLLQMSVRPLKENDGVESTKEVITGNIYVVGAYYTYSERLTKTECICFSQLLDSGKLCPFSSRMCWDSTDPFQTKTTRRNNKVIR